MSQYLQVDNATGRIEAVIQSDRVIAAPTGKTLVDVTSWSVVPTSGIYNFNTQTVSALPVPTVVSRIQFAMLFTQAERIAIRQRQATDDADGRELTDSEYLLSLAGDTIPLTHPLIAARLDKLVALGIINAARKTAILANQPPS